MGGEGLVRASSRLEVFSELKNSLQEGEGMLMRPRK